MFTTKSKVSLKFSGAFSHSFTSVFFGAGGVGCGLLGFLGVVLGWGGVKHKVKTIFSGIFCFKRMLV